MKFQSSLCLFVCLLGFVLCGEDFYKLLGIQRDASNKEIRKAFKKLAVTMHPDKNPVRFFCFFSLVNVISVTYMLDLIHTCCSIQSQKEKSNSRNNQLFIVNRLLMIWPNVSKQY